MIPEQSIKIINGHTICLGQGFASRGFFRAQCYVDGAPVQVYSSGSEDAYETWRDRGWEISLGHPAVIALLNA